MDLPGSHCCRIAALVLVALTLAGCGAAWVRWDEGAADRHEVKAGDTLYAIAFRHQLETRSLAHWNGLEPWDTIYPGQRLKLYPPLPGESRRPPPVPRGAPPPPRRPSRAASAPPPAGGTAPDPEPPAPMPSAAPYRWQWPADGAVIAGFAPSRGRKGLDIAGRPGDAVRASSAGKVVYAGSALKGYGLLLIVKHDEDYLSAYGHNRRLLVSEGDLVTAGQPIAELGVGPQQQPLLHFEIRRNGKPVDPRPLLPRRAAG